MEIATITNAACVIWECTEMMSFYQHEICENMPLPGSIISPVAPYLWELKHAATYDHECVV